VAVTKAKKKTASTSYAIIETGGKQMRVSPGDKIEVERLAVDKGSVIELDRVLLISEGTEVKIGTPVVEGAKVTADVLGEEKAIKLSSISTSPRCDIAIITVIARFIRSWK